ncbi:hypothetical protein vseg_000071 [Gypsophila vaccaria]
MAIDLPEDIFFAEILPKLPAKSLLRFKTVSKFCGALISSPSFVNHHLRHSNHRLVVVNLAGGPHLYDVDSPEIPPSPIHFPSDFKPYARNGTAFACDGLLVFSENAYDNNVARFVVINPFTGFYRYILPEFVFSHAFGYDHLTNDYKFVDFDVGLGRVKVYSLMSDSSNLINSPGVIVNENFIENRKFAIVVNRHLCHWLLWCPVVKKHRIVCFDLCIDDWTKDVPIPSYDGNGSGSCLERESSLHFADRLFEDCRDKKFDVIHLAVFEGCLSVLTRNMSCHGHFDVWAMKEYGVAESWGKLFSVPDEWSVPLCYSTRLMSKVLLWRMNDGGKGELVWYNIRDERSKKAEIHGVHRVRRLYNASVFTGSLVTVPGGQLIRRDD